MMQDVAKPMRCKRAVDAHRGKQHTVLPVLVATLITKPLNSDLRYSGICRILTAFGNNHPPSLQLLLLSLPLSLQRIVQLFECSYGFRESLTQGTAPASSRYFLFSTFLDVPQQAVGASRYAKNSRLKSGGHCRAFLRLVAEFVQW